MVYDTQYGQITEISGQWWSAREKQIECFGAAATLRQCAAGAPGAICEAHWGSIEQHCLLEWLFVHYDDTFLQMLYLFPGYYYSVLYFFSILISVFFSTPILKLGLLCVECNVVDTFMFLKMEQMSLNT